MAREGQGYPCYQRDMMMMMTYSYKFKPEIRTLVRKLERILIKSYRQYVYHTGDLVFIFHIGIFFSVFT